MDPLRRRRGPSQQSQCSSAPPPRSPASPTHPQFSVSSHPYASYCTGAATTPAPPPSSPFPLTNSYDDYHQHLPMPQTPLRRSRSARSSGSIDCRAAACLSTTSSPASALQQQHETTRLLSRLFAGVTLQWKQVVEQLKDAGVPLSTAALEDTVMDNSERILRFQTKTPPPLSSSATTANTTGTTRTYLHEGLHFDVQAHAARREQEQRGQANLQLRRSATVQPEIHLYHQGDENIDDETTELYCPLTEQQTGHYIQAEKNESGEVSKEAVKGATIPAAAASWDSLTPSAQWVPYVVGNSSVELENAKKSRTKEETRYEGLYDEALFAPSRSSRQRSLRRRSTRERLSRCASCDDDDARADFHLDDTTRLRTAVLRGMAQSAEKMIMGMRLVQQVLPASMNALRSLSATLKAVDANRNRTPTRLHQRHFCHRNDNADDGFGDDDDTNASNQLTHTHPMKSKAFASRRRRASSPPPHSPHVHKSHNNNNNNRNSGSLKAAMRRCRSAGNAEKVLNEEAATTTKIIYPALPVGQRTWIYPRIDDSLHSFDVYSRAVRSKHRSPPHQHHHPHHYSSNRRENDTKHSRVDAPLVSHRAISPSKSPSTPALCGVTPIAHRSVGSSMLTETVEHGQSENTGITAVACVDADKRQRRTASPRHVQRQLNWPARAVAAESNAAVKPTRTTEIKYSRRSSVEWSSDVDVSLSAQQVVKQIQHAWISALVQAETEARLCIAVYRENSMNSLLHAHFQQLWRLRGDDAVVCGQMNIKRKSASQDGNDNLPCFVTKRRGTCFDKSVEASASPAPAVPPSVSVSPFSSPSITPQLSPQGAAILICDSNGNGGSESASAASVKPSNFSSDTSRRTASTPSPSPPTNSDGDSIFSVHSPNTVEIEVTVPQSPTSPEHRQASPLTTLRPTAPQSPSPPSTSGKIKPSPGLEVLLESPTRHVSRSLPPPPPSPEERTPTALTQPPATATASPSRSTTRTLISPPNELTSQAEKRCLRKWDTILPRSEPRKPSGVAEEKQHLHDRASTQLLKYVGEGLAVSPRLSPASMRHDKCRSSHNSILNGSNEKTSDAYSPTQCESGHHRGVVVALELFPVSPPDDASCSAPATKPPYLQPQQRQHRTSLTSPSPTDAPLPPAKSDSSSAATTVARAFGPPGRTTSTLNGVDGRASERDVTTHSGHGAGLKGATRSRGELRRTLMTSVAYKARNADKLLAPALNALSASRNDKPLSHSDDVRQERKASCGITRQSSPNVTQYSRNDHSGTICCVAESASPPVPAVDNVNGTTDYSFVSAFYSNIPEKSAAAEMGLIEVQPPAKRSPRAPRAELTGEEDEAVTEKEVSVASNNVATLPREALQMLEQTNLVEAGNDERKQEVPSPPPRLPTP